MRAGDRPPAALIGFVAEQIGVLPESIDEYLAAKRNCWRHSLECQQRLGLRPFGKKTAAELAEHLSPQAIENDRLAYLAPSMSVLRLIPNVRQTAALEAPLSSAEVTAASFSASIAVGRPPRRPRRHSEFVRYHAPFGAVRNPIADKRGFLALAFKRANLGRGAIEWPELTKWPFTTHKRTYQERYAAFWKASAWVRSGLNPSFRMGPMNGREAREGGRPRDAQQRKFLLRRDACAQTRAVVVISPEGQKVLLALRFAFLCSSPPPQGRSQRDTAAAPITSVKTKKIRPTMLPHR